MTASSQVAQRTAQGVYPKSDHSITDYQRLHIMVRLAPFPIDTCLPFIFFNVRLTEVTVPEDSDDEFAYEEVRVSIKVYCTGCLESLCP